MKRIILGIGFLFLVFAGISQAEGSDTVTVTSLDETTFVVVKDMGLDSSGIELFKIVDGRIILVDSLFVWEQPVNKAVKYKRFDIKEY